MNLALNEIELPFRIRFRRPLSDDQLFRFCAVNEPFRVERDANGELIVMSPTGLEGSSWNTEIITELTIWARQDGRAGSSIRMAALPCPMDRCAQPMRRGYRGHVGTH